MERFNGISVKTKEKWLKVLKKGRFTESELIFFRKASKYSMELRNEFEWRMPEGGYRLTKEQQAKGTKYLLSKSLKVNGEERKGNKLGRYELEILQDPKVTHRLVGKWYLNPNVYYWMPVYRATDSQGNGFDYIGTTYEMMEVL